MNKLKLSIILKESLINKQLLGQFGNIKVYKVDGEQVRNLSKSNEEFGLSSIHAFLDIIPENEVWIENNIKKDELPIIIYTALYQLKQIASGKNPDVVYPLSIKKEKQLREKVKLNKNYYLPGNINKNVANKDVYVKRYCIIDNNGKDKIVVWLVDGEKVRDLYKTDFMEGGHGYVYPWISDNEIWIEFGLDEEEIPYIILHEFVERAFMKIQNIVYDKAHEIAAKIEWSKRPNGIDKEYIEKLNNEYTLELESNLIRK